MSFLNNEDDEIHSDGQKPRSNPSRLPSKFRSKENSLELHRWHSFKDELIRDRKEHSYSSHIQKQSMEYSEPKINSLILGDRSNSELRNSVASKYVDYLDHYKKNMNEITKHNENNEGRDTLKLRSYKDNILLNSTILSNCFNDRSFQNPIHELSNEADFIEEKNSGASDDEEEGSDFFDENPKEGFSKIYNNMERESFSFDNNRALSGFLEDIQGEPPKIIPERNYEESFDTLEQRDQIHLEYFFEKKEDREMIKEYNTSEQFIKINVVHLTLADNALKEEYILTRRGLVNSKKNTKSKSIVIGRMSSAPDEVFPNDIVLPYADKSISRVHCCILYKNVFTPRRIPTNFVAFLSGKKYRKEGSQSKIYRLGHDIIHKIYSYVCPSSKIYAIDLGSTTGTYKRIQFDIPHKIRKGDLYMVGNGYNMTVNYMSSSRCKSSGLKELYQLLADEPEDKTDIHGLTIEQMRKVDHLREKKKSVIKEILKEDEGDSFLNENLRGTEMHFPMLIIEIDNPPSTIKPIQ